MSQVAVIGAGSWGTALSLVLADNGCDVRLFARRQEQIDEINHHHTNHRYLPDITLPHTIKATNDITVALKNTRVVVLVTPSKALRDILPKMLPYLKADTTIVHASKGLEPETSKRISQVIEEEIPATHRRDVAVLSGPSHAEEVSRRQPTTVTVSSRNDAVARDVQDVFINEHFRVYTNSDMIGVELGGSLKNIIALGAGMSDGLGYGDNAKAALITRGLAEITRLGVAMGANPLTFAGLSGIGDLIVTCTSVHSRNWRAGHSLGQGESVESVLHNMGMVVEGVRTTKATYELAQQRGISMPITTELYHVLFEGKDPKQAVDDLMGRGRTNEMQELSQLLAGRLT